MQSVPGYTKDEVLETIITVTNRVCPKYKMNGFDADDMKQEGFIICVKVLPKYDQSIGPLENFLSRHLRNRMINLLRDNNATAPTKDTDKGKIAHPAQLDNEFSIRDGANHLPPLDERIRTKEIAKIVSANIPPDMRLDYLKMINDEQVPASRRKQIEECIKHLLESRGYNIEKENEEEGW